MIYQILRDIAKRVISRKLVALNTYGNNNKKEGKS